MTGRLGAVCPRAGKPKQTTRGTGSESGGANAVGRKLSDGRVVDDQLDVHFLTEHLVEPELQLDDLQRVDRQVSQVARGFDRLRHIRIQGADGGQQIGFDEARALAGGGAHEVRVRQQCGILLAHGLLSSPEMTPGLGGKGSPYWARGSSV